MEESLCLAEAAEKVGLRLCRYASEDFLGFGGKVDFLDFRGSLVELRTWILCALMEQDHRRRGNSKLTP